jgi:anti-anti-sigma factor
MATFGPFFNIQTARERDEVRITVAGELDVGTAPQLTACLGEHNDHSGRLVLDLSAVGFIDSTGLRILIAADEHARATGRALTLVPSEAVVHVVRITGLEQRLLSRSASMERSADAASLVIEHDHALQCHTLRLRGAFTRAGLPGTERALRTALDSRASKVRLDLAGVSCIDPDALQFLARAHLDCVAAGRQLELCPPAGPAAHVLTNSTVIDALSIEP